MPEFSIYEGYIPKLEKKLKTIANKCKKFGCEFTYNVIGEEYKDIEIEGITHKIKFVRIEAEGTAKVNDWVFVASVNHTSNGNIIRTTNNSVEIPKRYYDSDSYCEHCKTKRTRKDTYIVYNEKTKEFKQVGKSCLRDFTGGLSSEAIAGYYSFFDSLENYQNDTSFFSSRCIRYYPTFDVLLYFAETIKHFGFVKTDNVDKWPTAYRGLDYYSVDNNGFLFDVKERKSFRDDMNRVNFNAESKENKELVKKAIEWLETQEDNNTYIHNLKTIIKNEYMTSKNAGFLASLFPTYYRAMEREEERNNRRKNSKHIGEIGKKINFDVDNIKFITAWENMYNNYTYMYRITDTYGNICIWKKTGGIDEETLNKSKKCVATVKAHSEFNGVKQTELIRCKFSV